MSKKDSGVSKGKNAMKSQGLKSTSLSHWAMHNTNYYLYLSFKCRNFILKQVFFYIGVNHIDEGVINIISWIYRKSGFIRATINILSFCCLHLHFLSSEIQQWCILNIEQDWWGLNYIIKYRNAVICPLKNWLMVA